MRRFANLYIVLFLVDAGLSLTDELQAVFAPPSPGLSGLRFLVAYLVIALSLLFYPLMGIDRRLPKRVLLPLTLYVFWCTMALWPLQGMVPRASFGVLAAWGQVFVGGVAVITLRSFYGNVLLPEEHFRGPLFAWRNTLVFSGVNLLLLPFLVVYSLLAVTGQYLDQATAGFLRLTPIGIYTAERSYHLGGKSVRLAAMMHFGRQEFYRELADSLPAARTIILAEGVTDRDGLLKNRFTYRNLAGLVGLSSQETMQLDANPIQAEELDRPIAPGRNAVRPDILRADVDVNQFNPDTIEFLNVLGSTLLAQRPLGEGMAEYGAWVKSRRDPGWFAETMNDLLARRNEVVIDTLERSLKRYDTVVIPWGAMHMPAIEAAILEQRFVPVETHERLVVDFRALPYARLWERFSSSHEGAQGVSGSSAQGKAIGNQ